MAANLTAKDGLLTARATLTGLVIPGPSPGLLQDAPLTVNATAQLNDPKRPDGVTASLK